MLKNESVSYRYSISKCVLCMKADDALSPIFISSFQVHYARQFQGICALWHLKMFPFHGVADASLFFFPLLATSGVISTHVLPNGRIWQSHWVIRRLAFISSFLVYYTRQLQEISLVVPKLHVIHEVLSLSILPTPWVSVSDSPWFT